jgi:hypothetical protein
MTRKRAAFAGRISRPAKLRLDRHAAADIAISCRRRIRNSDAHPAIHRSFSTTLTWPSAFNIATSCNRNSRCTRINVFPLPRGEAGTSSASQAYWQVDDIEREVAELKKPGIVFEDYDMGHQDGLRHLCPRRQESASKTRVARPERRRAPDVGHERGPGELAHVRRLDHGRAP